MPLPDSSLIPLVAQALVEIVPAVNRSLRVLLAQGHPVVSVPQFRVLAWLKGSTDLTLKELAGREGVAPPTMSRAVETLQQKGWLTRYAASTDKRCVKIALTDAGSALVDEIRLEMSRQLEARLESWEPSALAQLLESLAHLRTSALILPSSGVPL